MLNGFDYAFTTDFVREHGGGLPIIFNLSQGILIIYFVFSVFWMGGILKVLKKEDNPFSFRKFLQGSAHYFWRLIRLSIYFIIFHVINLLIFVFIFLKIGVSPFEMESEVIIINSIKIMLPIFLLISTILFLVHDYAKIQIIHQKKKIITRPILDSFRFVFKNFKKCIGLYLLNLLTFGIFFGIYWLLSNSFKSTTSPSIFLLFIIGQAFIFSRIATKLLNIGSAISLFQKIQNPV